MDKDENIIPSLEDSGEEVSAVTEADSPCDVTEEASAEVTCEAEETSSSDAESVTEAEDAEILSEEVSSEAEADVEYIDLYENVDEADIIHADGNFDADEWITSETKAKADSGRTLRSVYELIEMLSLVAVAIVLCFSFVFRLNIVEGPSMEQTLSTGEYLIVSDLLYTPTPGDIVVVHDMTAGAYTDPIVKRVIAVGGQTVDIDFSTWTLTVDGEEVDESAYRYLTDRLMLTNMTFPITLEDGEVFVMGDNRNHSADSRLPEIGPIDERCIVGKVYVRVFPIDKFTIFKNPYES